MRENLAFGGTILLKWFIYPICGILLLPSLLEALSQNSIELIGAPLAMLVLMLVIRPICDVYIDGKYIYAKRLVKKIELSPADIEDVNFWGITGLIKMTLTKDPALHRAGTSTSPKAYGPQLIPMNARNETDKALN